MEKSTLTENKNDWIKSFIRDIADFPKPGIVFKDLTPLFKDIKAFAYVIDVLAEKLFKANVKYVAGIEARGFIVGSILAHKLGIGFIPIRKVGKLPHKVEKIIYDLEYGSACLEIHVDAVNKNDGVILIDDVLATGGTAAAAIQLLQTIGAEIVGLGFIIELQFLNGRQKLPKDLEIFSLCQYP